MNFLREHFDGGRLNILVTYDAIVVTPLEDTPFSTRAGQGRDLVGIKIAELTGSRRSKNLFLANFSLEDAE